MSFEFRIYLDPETPHSQGFEGKSEEAACTRLAGVSTPRAAQAVAPNLDAPKLKPYPKLPEPTFL